MKTAVMVPVLLLSAFSVLPIHAQDQGQSKLPAGCYVFIGKQPGDSPPKYLYIGEDGSVHWNSSTASRKAGTKTSMPTMATPGHSPSGAWQTNDGNINSDSPTAAPQSQRGEFERYEYPFIKWKAKMLPTGAVVQLETTLDGVPGGGGGSGGGFKYNYRGTVKYKVNVLVRGNAIISTQGIHFELLDDKGFSLATFVIPANALSVIPGTQVMESRGLTSMSESDYQRAVDIAVK